MSSSPAATDPSSKDSGTSAISAISAIGAASAINASSRPLVATPPRATYRVQLHSDFGFADATALVPYRAALGISHLCTSPLLRARPGSRHGYDVVDHGQLNAELGTRADFDRLVDALHSHGMGLLMDIVPNHMGVLSGDNAWWLDVLENGAASAHADCFDIDWAAADPALTGRVLLPLLGDQYGVVLERGELQLGFDRERGYFTLSHYEHRLTIDPASYGGLLRAALHAMPAAADADALAAEAQITQLSEAFERLPPHGTPDESARGSRQREKTALKAELAALAGPQTGAHAALAPAIDQVVATLNGRVGEDHSFDALDALIDAQPYRLAQWRVAGAEINYRRFFDINELAALRMEQPRVFDDTHRLVLELAASGAVDGLRIDHPDGLADPAGYFRRLQQRFAEVAGLPASAGDAEPAALPLYVVVEKIVAPHEEVPRDWAVHGSTGYRFSNVVNGLLVDGGAKNRLDRVWRAFVGDEAEEFHTPSWQGCHVVMAGPMAGELTVLATALRRLARADRRTRDFTLNGLRGALAEVVAAFPVYRTYIVDAPSPQDLRFIDWAIGLARRRSRAEDASVFDFRRRVMLGRPEPGAPAGLAGRYLVFARRLQQYTSPVAAKGIEDTALYRHHRLISVNDVGGEPDDFGYSVPAFHAASLDRARHRPATMLTTSTHDAKRSEDVRLRIDVISEMPAACRLTVRRWSRLNRSPLHEVDGARAPSRNDEYLLYQTRVGSLPPGPLDAPALQACADRVEQALLKSARESKAVSSWINPNAGYEVALSGFVQALLRPRDSNLFLADLLANAAVFAWYGALNGLTLAVVKILSPGVPDIYQGHEAIELSLVDPDNRRPIDYALRQALLADASAVAGAGAVDRTESLRGWLAAAPDGRAKFFASWRALQLRQRFEAMLRRGDYRKLEVRGERARHVVAFARCDNAQVVVVVVVVAARLHASMGLAVGEPPVGEVWGDTAIVWPATKLPAVSSLDDAIGGRHHAVVDGMLAVADLLRDFPVAALGAGASAAG